ncbi:MULTISPECIES: endonuclease/exonuclease/phosphatase family protein [unclassified Solwaraspora]|uniref:endonuclease/exonuclease/phosphatase family protein n=1 Tax=unclassified Solwaraspora TaxID=2627926 RepID=UPI00259B9792|nr:endonuclease/exonuclease/phosphatase family protein [Solwaraspora sp. WMMA2056]WJK38193.1 endonuclease/exonuclease/phosphatase family protein [Solwaraspora sp. WMMA2056]
MTQRRHTPTVTGLAAVLAAVLATGLAPGPASAGRPTMAPRPVSAGGPDDVRFATFNASLNRAAAGALVADLSTPGDRQAANVAEVIQRVRPDVLLINEFDHDPQGRAVDLFQRNYLSRGQGGAAPIHYPYRFSAPSNTGVPSGHDLNRDGTVGGPDDAYGFGAFPGQYGMAVYSRHPIDLRSVRTFQTFRWRDMPGALLPDDPATDEPGDWYSPAALADLRLSSKSHWDVPVRVGRQTVHLLASHPTPPVFDGPEDRNGRRNHDEIRFWADYVRPARSGYIYDDRGRRGGLRPGARFVIAGDLNSDPYDGDSLPGAARQLTGHPLIDDRRPPASAGGPAAAQRQGGANLTHVGDPRFDTADFADGTPGNLRVDYLLPARGLPVRGAGVFWPTPDDPLFRLVGDYDPALPGGFPTSDHRLVWLDVRR